MQILCLQWKCWIYVQNFVKKMLKTINNTRGFKKMYVHLTYCLIMMKVGRKKSTLKLFLNPKNRWKKLFTAFLGSCIASNTELQWKLRHSMPFFKKPYLKRASDISGIRLEVRITMPLMVISWSISSGFNDLMFLVLSALKGLT